ncbi:MAG: hypothetical protein M3Y71_10440 [Actinomycetota bacterium]|nr:hypothetical protein [Actinomycetota bacterium]
MTTATGARRASAGEQRVRFLLIVIGVALALVGAYSFIDAEPLGQWLRVVLWLAAGVVLHDAVVAPLALALGAGVLHRVTSPSVRRLLRALLLLMTAGVVVAVPLLATGGLR